MGVPGTAGPGALFPGIKSGVNKPVRLMKRVQILFWTETDLFDLCVDNNFYIAVTVNPFTD
jgi:hypothetical protein